MVKFKYVVSDTRLLVPVCHVIGLLGVIEFRRSNWVPAIELLLSLMMTVEKMQSVSNLMKVSEILYIKVFLAKSRGIAVDYPVEVVSDRFHNFESDTLSPNQKLHVQRNDPSI